MSEASTTIVQRYFERMRARDLSVIDLFHEDASVIGLGSTRSGKAAIRELYETSIRSVSPSPELIGDLLVSGSRVGAEIRISFSNGGSVHVMDLFVIEDGLIRSLTYFVADH